MSAGPYAIGSDHLPGLSKLVEELGEGSQAAGKIMGVGHMGEHWDGGPPLKERLEDELADIMAATQFFAERNGLDMDRMSDRAGVKLATFERWHAERSS